MKPSCALVCVLLACVLGGCVSGGQRANMLEPGQQISIKPVRNLAGVPIKIPELYLGDGAATTDLEFDSIDIALNVEAALLAWTRASGHTSTDPGDFELHAAVTRFDITTLRSTGTVSLGVAVMLVDTQGQNVLAEGVAEQDYQLMDQAPDDAGLLGEQRFIRTRLEAFIEAITLLALQRARL
jgi:hypothetical protein